MAVSITPLCSLCVMDVRREACLCLFVGVRLKYTHAEQRGDSAQDKASFQLRSHKILQCGTFLQVCAEVFGEVGGLICNVTPVRQPESESPVFLITAYFLPMPLPLFIHCSS